MKKIFSILITITLTSVAYCQSLNFSFEHIQSGMPTGWINFGKMTYLSGIDSSIVKAGKYAAFIEYKEGESNFKAWSFAIPNNYPGKKITLSGYIKTENVSDGYAGLWMRIDPSIAFDNMNKNPIKGTTDWKKYEITLKMNPEKTKQIVVGGLLVGKGKMWIDDLKVTIDGIDIRNIKPYESKLLPAQKDNSFDNGSKIFSIAPDSIQIKQLKKLGLIWGFLKYYHPSIAKGNYNWDYELFKIIPEVLKVYPNNFDKIMLNWIDGLGNFTEGKPINTDPKEIKLEPDLDWINTIGFSNELSQKLLKIKNAERSESHYYIGLYPNVKNPEFKNEDAYGLRSYPDAGIRLLCLYRYWNMIQYYFPYKNLIEEDWKNVLEEFIPKMLAANDEKGYVLTTLELIARIHDTHANIWGSNSVLTNYFGQKYAPVELTFVEEKPVVTSFYDDGFGKETGLKIGDVITEINNQSIGQIIQSQLKITPASNYPTQLRDIAKRLLRSNDSIIQVKFIRDGIAENRILKTFTTKEIKIFKKFENQDTCFKMITQDIAYINNGTMQKSYLPAIWKTLKNTKGLIIDIRNYPSDFPIHVLSEYLLPKRNPFVKFSNGNIKTPGLFTYKYESTVGKDNNNFYNGKIVILINEISQSSAEFHAMAYRVHPYATVIGSTTAGADGNVSKIVLPGGISTMISGIGVYYPDGKETQRIGIVPDIIVKPTIKGIKEGRDELMEKAIEIINAN